jgi:hypothetical protein
MKIYTTMLATIQFQQNKLLASYPPQWETYYDVFYKDTDEFYFHKITMTYAVLKKFLEINGKPTTGLCEMGIINDENENDLEEECLEI